MTSTLNGDEILREVACRLSDSVPSYDAVSRYGGEEFLAVLYGCRTRVGASRAQNIRRAIHALPVKTAAGPMAVSMSRGVAGTEDWQESHVEQLIHPSGYGPLPCEECGRNCSVLAKPSGVQEIHTANLGEDNVPAR